MNTTHSWSRLRSAGLVRVLLVYLGASWVILEVADVFIDKFGMPTWFFQAAILLLLIGLVVVVATSLVQSRPEMPTDAHVPAPWDVDLVDLRESVARGRLPHLTWARALFGGAFAFALLFGFAGLYVLLSGRDAALPLPTEAEAAAPPGVAVLPFRVVGPDLELWREGMVDLLSTNLDGAAGLRTIDPRAVLSHWRVEIGEGAEAPDREVALGVARSVGATYALTGSMVGSPRQVRLRAEVYDLGTGRLQGAAQVEGSPDSILQLVDGLSIEVLGAGWVKGPRELPDIALSRVTTGSVDALKAFLSGEQDYRRGRFESAAAHFEDAVEADSTFALALLRLSLVYTWLEPTSPRVIDYGERAARHAERLPRRERLLMQGVSEMEQGRLSAIDKLEELTAHHPDDAEGWYQLGEAYYHIGAQGLHGPAKSRNAFRGAIELDPSYAPAYIHLIQDAFERRDSADARELIEALRRLDPTNPAVTGSALAYALVWGDSATRSGARAAIDTVEAIVLGSAFQSLARADDPVEHDPAMRVAEALLDRPEPGAQWFGRFGLVAGHTLRGEIERARALTRPPEGEPQSLWSARALLRLHLAGYADTSSAGGAAATLRAAGPAPVDRFLIGGFATTIGDWPRAEGEIGALESAAEEATARWDSIVATENRAFAIALRGYAALRRGDASTAAGHLERALPELPGYGPDFTRSHVHELLRYELGRTFLELGRPTDAEPYLQSVWRMVVGAPVDFYLGRTYEALEDPERARLHYGRFVSWWENCDPELEPWRERGRRALERLSGELAKRE